MNREIVDRLVGRIVQETRLARAASHPRARIAHHMLADAYRAMVSRMTMIDDRDERRRVSALALNGVPLLQRVSIDGTPTTGFLADMSG